VLDAIDTKIGAQLRLWRCLKGVGKADLGREIGLSPAHLALIEDGRGRLGTARLFAAARSIGVPVSTLLEGANDNWF
jgi:transcriptional regulator with XRE-family HTH domain